MTLERLLSAYGIGHLTRNELFARLVDLLSPDTLERIRIALQAEPGFQEAFEGWLAGVEAGAEVVSGGKVVSVSDGARAAVSLWRARATSESGRLASGSLPPELVAEVFEYIRAHPGQGLEGLMAASRSPGAAPPPLGDEFFEGMHSPEECIERPSSSWSVLVGVG
ncbi:hypothetical protein [Sorangium cellulosum]|uniref:Uncharacterized protein n=1 Tax=Sorangium cellulosum TaxID=56 RepID=A0A150QVV1_SORCE|nr:hypothetical protein [Sorangium cellulosum]KYF72091.1 hypothetical protein BE15_08130 [Sorangium cellulosum]